MSAFLPYLKLMRPHQWVKSGFVFVGLFFGHAWHDAHIVHMVLLSAAAFSSTIWLIGSVIANIRKSACDRLRRVRWA